MRYVKQIESNVKGMTGPVVLGPRTLILGPNGSGKSAITSAVELALTGAVSDVVGRETVKDVNQLLTLGPGESLFATATVGDTDSDAAVGTVGHATKGKKLIGTPAPVAVRLPLRDIREALAGGVEKVRRYFLGMVAGGVRLDDVRDQIPEPLMESFEIAIAGTPINIPAVDTLLAGLDRAKTKLRDLRAESKAGSTVSDDVGRGLAAPPSGQSLEAARRALAAARDAVENAVLLGGSAKARAEAEAAASDAAERLADAKAAFDAAVAGGSVSVPAKADEIRGAFIEAVKFLAESAAKSCACCGRPADDVDWEARVAKLQAKQDERQKLFADHTMLAAALAEAAADNRAAQEVLARTPVAVSSDVDVDALRDEAIAAEQKVIEMERTAAQWETAKKARDVAAGRDLQAARWEQLVDVLKGVVGTLLDLNVARFTKRVQQFLPPSDRFYLRLRDEDREVCQYGFLRDERLDVALSGAEWARLCAALAAAALPDNFEGLAVIIPEDRSWDRHTLRAVMQYIERAPCQVLLATTTDPGEVPPAWVVVRTAEAAPGVEIVVGRCQHGVEAGRTCLECGADSAPRAAPAAPAAQEPAAKPARKPRRPRAPAAPAEPVAQAPAGPVTLPPNLLD